MAKGEGTLGSQLVLHACANKACVNPAHLRYGTAAENIQDAKRDGAWPMGKGSNPRRLSAEHVLEAFGRQMLEGDEFSIRATAADFGCAPATLRRALRPGPHQTWTATVSAHVDEALAAATI